MWLTGPAAPRHVGSSQTRARTRVPCIGRRILNHCATREGGAGDFLRSVSSQKTHSLIEVRCVPVETIHDESSENENPVFCFFFFKYWAGWVRIQLNRDMGVGSPECQGECCLIQESFLSEPVLSDGPLEWCVRLPRSFPFCWAHTDVVNPLWTREWSEMRICLYSNSAGNTPLLCLLSWSLSSQMLACLL